MESSRSSMGVSPSFDFSVVSLTNWGSGISGGESDEEVAALI